MSDELSWKQQREVQKMINDNNFGCFGVIIVMLLLAVLTSCMDVIDARLDRIEKQLGLPRIDTKRVLLEKYWK